MAQSTHLNWILSLFWHTWKDLQRLWWRENI